MLVLDVGSGGQGEPRVRAARRFLSRSEIGSSEPEGLGKVVVGRRGVLRVPGSSEALRRSEISDETAGVDDAGRTLRRSWRGILVRREGGVLC